MCLMFLMIGITELKVSEELISLLHRGGMMSMMNTLLIAICAISFAGAMTVTEALLPWTTAGAYMTSTLGIPILSYLPWVVLNYSEMIFALIWGTAGIGIIKIDSETYSS